MLKRHLRLPALSLLLIGLIDCSQLSKAENQQQPTSVAVSPPSTPSKTAVDGNLTQLFSRIWRVTKAPSEPASGSIYIFLPNGTLLETSCVETYRLATWTSNKKAPRILRVVENGQLAFIAQITQLTDTTLRLQQKLVRSNEKRDITLTAVEQEFVCPDLPK